MFGKNPETNGSPSHDNEANHTTADYVRIAQSAEMQGEHVLAMHLYLIAFEKSIALHGKATPDAVDALRKAWDICVQLKERSLAEYIFERLEPYLSADEISEHGEQLQHMALEKLEEFGLSREDVQDMADMISDDALSIGGIMQVQPEFLLNHHGKSDYVLKPSLPTASHVQLANTSASDTAADSKQGTVDVSATSKSVTASANSLVSKDDADSLGQDKSKGTSAEVVSDDKNPVPSFSFDDLVGFDRAIEEAHRHGVGLSDDSSYNEFVTMLAQRHGISHVPSRETILFRSLAREDADQFMAAVVEEIGLPTVRMNIEENIQGMPALCVSTSPDYKNRLHIERGGIVGPSMLMLEDIDLWGTPLPDGVMDPSMFNQLSRGAREAISIIRSAIDNPDVMVVASSSNDYDVDSFFYGLLEPLHMVEIAVPDAKERLDVWHHAAQMYPSLRSLNMAGIVRVSANMSRVDIYNAAREAVEDAYRQSLDEHTFVPVTQDNLYDKIGSYQPLESSEYHEIEEAAVESLRHDLERDESHHTDSDDDSKEGAQ